LRHGEAERLGGSEVVYKLELDRLKYRQVSGFSPHEGMIRLGELGRQPVIGLSYRGNNLCTMELRRRQFLHLGGAAALAPLSRYAYAQGWPTRSVRLIVGFAPDNGLNSVAHILADRLSEIWNQQVIVENEPGDDLRIGFDAVAHAAPDGHTILIAAGAPEVNRFLFSKLTFDPATDIMPLSLVGTFPDIIIVPNSSPLYTVEKFIAYAGLVLASSVGRRPVSARSPISPASCSIL
jgi:hypothetical protein